MIKCKKGKVTLNGSPTELLAELAGIVEALNFSFTKRGHGKDETKEMLEKAFSLGLKTKEELKEEALASIRKVIDSLGEALEEPTDETEVEGEEDNGSDK